MKIVASVVILFFASVLAYAQGPKSCEELKAEIAKKVEANGAKAYTLEIVPKDKEAEGKEVGHCGGGTMKIMYLRTSPPPATATAPKPATPAKAATTPKKPAPATPKP
ncbi:MAG: DUF1161 domain-containing protein [Terracidiphilus sp.]